MPKLDEGAIALRTYYTIASLIQLGYQRAIALHTDYAIAYLMQLGYRRVIAPPKLPNDKIFPKSTDQTL
ncbi:hypothetical protein H6F96_07480 [Microcoleus sp. FACHB-53]|nr:hypothetical protein [Microcoleus sp. FACHB-53]